MAVVDKESIKTKIRFLVGGLTTEDLSDATLSYILDECIVVYTDDQEFLCEITYCTLLNSLKYLIKQSWVEGGGNVGDVTRKREKEGGVEYEESYSTSYSDSSGWEKLYEYFRDNPKEVCISLQTERNKNTVGMISIGGTRKDEYDKIENGSNNKSLWGKGSIGSKFSYEREVYRRKREEQSKY